MIGIIELENIEFTAYHGCFKEEKIIGNKFIVNLKVTTDVSKASKSDNILEALNYQTLFDLIKEQMKITSNILEHVCARILDAIYEQFGKEVINATVTVSKCNPPLGGKLDKVSLTLSR
jgi:7,8-dihydroneopterin aldolase/epimerase/oxygenase